MSHTIQPTQIKYNPYYSEDLNRTATSLKRKALSYEILSKITTLAMVAILGGVFALSLGLGASISSLPVLIFGGLLLLPPLQALQTSLHQKSLGLVFDKAMAMRCAEIYNEWKNKPVSELSARLTLSGIQVDRLPLHIFQQMNPQEPLKALLPLFAHFCAWDELRQEIHRHVEHDFSFNSPTLAKENPLLILQSRRHGWARLEKEEILASLNAAIIQKAMLDPTSLATTIENFSPRVKLHMKQPDQRFLDRLFDRDDLYLSFSEQGRAPLTFEDLLQPSETHPEQKNLAALAPDKMRLKLYNI